ncbi:MAG TPA: hypothetical protein VGX51_13405 [Solirubrobacteraceae bacterium]|nr:hypothetical protein [Solirubrobacteraceae bacterium]
MERRQQRIAVNHPSNGQFICFEPMAASANALRSGVGLRVLSPGETFRACFSLGVSSPPE